MKRSTTTLAALGLFGGLAASSSCKVSRLEDHCANADGDAYCLDKHPDDADRRFCNLGTCDHDNVDGCGAQPMSDACYSPCGHDKSVEDDPDCEGQADTSTGGETLESTLSGDPSSVTEPSTSEPTATTVSTSMTSSETEASTSTTGGGCTDSGECLDPNLPICSELACVACTDAPLPDNACAERDPALPVCGDDGACVQCTPENPAVCEDTTPVCDGPSNSCVGCTYHEQCPDSACRIATGACFDAGEVYDVGSGQTYPTITAAVGGLGEGVQVVLILHSGASFDEGITLSGADTAYAFLSEDDPPPQWIRSSGMGPTLALDGDAEAYFQNVRLTLNGFTGAPAIEADGASLYLDRTEVIGNDGGGLAVQGSGYAQVRTCIVGANGANNFSATTGIRVTDSTVDVVYSTLALNEGDAQDSMQCTNANGTFRNSIALGSDTMSYACAGVTTTNSAFDGAVAGNTNVGALQASWFDNVGSSVFTLTPAGEGVFGDVAEWQTGDPATDIDGGARPNVDGTADVAGADLP